MFQMALFRDLEKRKWFLLLIAMIVTTISACTRFIILNQNPAMPGADFGNYLAVVHIIEGNDVTGEGLRYPPLFFLALIPFIKVFGEMLALKVFSSVVASISCIPFFFLAKRWTRLSVAFGATVLFTFSKYLIDMTAWGGSPNFLAIAFMLTGFYFLDRALSESENRRRFSLIVGSMIGLVFLTYHLTLVIFLFTLLFLLIIEAVWARQRCRSALLPAYAWMIPSTVVLSIPAVSVYLRMQETASSSLAASKVATLSSFIGPEGLQAVIGPFLIAWVIVYIFSACVIVLAIRHPVKPGHKESLLAATIFSPVTVAFLMVGDIPGRGLAFLTIPLFLCVGLVVEMLIRKDAHIARWSFPSRLKPVVFSIFSIGVLFMGVLGAIWLDNAVEFYEIVGDGEIEAFDWIRDNTAAESTFATSGSALSYVKEGNVIGWWLQGYCERPTVMAGLRMYRLFQDEIESVVDMNRLFSGEHVFENGRLRVSETYPLLHMANPLVAVNRNDQYLDLLWFNDNEHAIYYTATQDSTDILRANMWDATNESLDIETDGSSYTWTVWRATDDIEMVRRTTIKDIEGVVEVTFQINPLSSSSIQGISLRLWPTSGTFTDLGCTEAHARFSIADMIGNGAIVEASVGEGSGRIQAVYHEDADPLYGLPRVSVDLSGEGAVEVDLRIIPDESDLDTICRLGYYNAYDLISKYGIDYLFERSSMVNEIERFRPYPDIFSVVYETSAVVIFKVQKENLPP